MKKINPDPNRIDPAQANFLLLAALFLAISLPVSAKTFSDVEENQTYSTAIEFLAAEGIVQGHPDGSFRPDDVLNRAEMIKIIAEGSVKYFKLSSDIFDEYDGKNCFNDVKAGQWYTRYVCYGKDKGWVQGYSKGKYFKPDQDVTFVEALKITFKGWDTKYKEEDEPWYKDLVNKASKKNYIPFDVSGFQNGLRRDQMADMITRMIKREQGSKSLEAYLGARTDIVVSYETLSDGLDLSRMEVETLSPS